MSFWVADYRGDVHINEGQLGHTIFSTITSNATMIPPTDFSKLYHRYIITNNTSSLDLELPNINTAVFTADSVYNGWTTFIKNAGTFDIVVKTPITGLTVSTINANDTIMISAKENNGQAVSDWEVYDLGFIGFTGPTGPKGPIGSTGTSGNQGLNGFDHDWYLQGTEVAPTGRDEDRYTLGQVVIGDGTTNDNLDSERLLVTGSFIANGDLNMPSSGVYDKSFVIGNGLRFGSASSTQWDSSNVGTMSASFGIDNINTGGPSTFTQGKFNSITIGAYNASFGSTGTISGSASRITMFGGDNTATSNNDTTIFGFNNTSTSRYGFINGQGNTINNDQGFAVGENNTMTGTNDTVCLFGEGNQANGTIHDSLFMLGLDNEASSGTVSWSLVTGRDNTITDCLYSTIIGRGITNNIDECFAMGAYGTVRNETDPSYQLFGGTTTGGSAGDGVGIVGRITTLSGTQPTGEIIANTFTTASADFGEYFEKIESLKDVNLDGYFISIDPSNPGKIKKAVNEDDVIGIGSATTMITGDAAELGWNGTITKDKLGRLETQYCKSRDFTNNFKKYYGNDETLMKNFIENINSFTEDNIQAVDDFIDNLPNDSIKTDFINYLNDDTRFRPQCNVTSEEYDPLLEYVPRSERKEWQIVGLLGKIYTYDDGTCVVGSKCTCNVNGIATNGNKWLVLERMKEYTNNDNLGVVRVLFK